MQQLERKKTKMQFVFFLGNVFISNCCISFIADGGLQICRNVE